MISIGELANRAGVNVQTVRYYERQGLLEPTLRSGAGYRLYTSEQVSRLHFIRKAQRLGFKLREVRELLDLERNASSCERVMALASGKLEEVQERLRDLAELQAVLQGLLEACHSSDPSQCSILKYIRSGEPG